MLYGLWTLKITGASSSKNSDSGVVILTPQQRILGGGSAVYYVGAFESDGDNIKGQVKVTAHFDAVGKFFGTAFGPYKKPFDVMIEGKVEDQNIFGKVWSPTESQHVFDMLMMKRENL